MGSAALAQALSQVPPGRWAVAVSGGADSVALLLLLNSRPDLSLYVVHLNHQTRGVASDGDAQFVAELADRLSLPCTIARRDEIEPKLANLPANLSARYRALRMELFRKTAKDSLGVILGHHADDQVETIALRLLRGSGPTGLAGMALQRRMNGLVILRPLLNLRRDELREYLVSHHQTWRDDASNESDEYARNRVRHWLAANPHLVPPLLELGRCCGHLKLWIAQHAPRLEENFAAVKLANLPRMLGRESARGWLRRQAVPAAELSPAVLDRLRQMAVDAATPSRRQFPGAIKVRRRGGRIGRDPTPSAPR